MNLLTPEINRFLEHWFTANPSARHWEGTQSELMRGILAAVPGVERRLKRLKFPHIRQALEGFPRASARIGNYKLRLWRLWRPA